MDAVFLSISIFSGLVMSSIVLDKVDRVDRRSEAWHRHHHADPGSWHRDCPDHGEHHGYWSRDDDGYYRWVAR